MANRHTFSSVKGEVWETLRSPKTIAFIKLVAAVVAVVHAVDEMRDPGGTGKRAIGFSMDEEDDSLRRGRGHTMAGFNSSSRATDLVETPLPELQKALSRLRPGDKVKCDNTRPEIMKVRENLLRRRHEIPGADFHLEYVEALLLAEASGQLSFKE